ncbi:MAG: transposase [Verrucomicrobia bacterium]|nr:transposase [Verrucomicrobiota bacterium]
MLVDGSSSHVAMAHRFPENIQLHRLPPYSPELNPVEHLWDESRCRCRQSAHYPIRASTLELRGSFGSISTRAGSLTWINSESACRRQKRLKWRGST